MTRKQWRTSSSSIRIMLKYLYSSQPIRSIEQFRLVRWRDTYYLWNSQANNIIMTTLETPTSLLIRYRESSYYSSCTANVKQWCPEVFNSKKSVVLPSMNLSRWSRRINRETTGYYGYSRENILRDLQTRDLLPAKIYDGITNKILDTTNGDRQAPQADFTIEARSTFPLNTATSTWTIR